MWDLSLNLPYWARLLDYKLEGGGGTYDDMYLYKGTSLVRVWDWKTQIPNILELEEMILELEGKEIMQRSKVTC